MLKNQKEEENLFIKYIKHNINRHQSARYQLDFKR